MNARKITNFFGYLLCLIVVFNIMWQWIFHQQNPSNMEIFVVLFVYMEMKFDEIIKKIEK
jgi:hypothetical protein